MTEYREIRQNEICRALWKDFIRRQRVVNCRRKINGEWTVRPDPFLDDWSEADYETLIACLKRTSETGGFVYGAFLGGALKGFVSVEPAFFGNDGEYLDLSSLHVSADVRGNGIGKTLFGAAKEWARQRGARKLYISAHSAVETQAFYAKTGCTDALFLHEGHAAAEPFDVPLECVL